MDFNELPTELQERLLNSSLVLMRDLTEIAGPEKGMELWDKISVVLGGEVRQKIFFGMINGQYTFNGVMFTQVNHDQAVPAIKAIRTATGIGLKEAKDLYDKVKFGTATRIECSSDKRIALLKTLTDFGHKAH